MPSASFFCYGLSLRHEIFLRAVLAALCLVCLLPGIAFGAPLTVQLQDGISAAGLSGKEVQALERQADGSLIAVAVRTTDTQGAARFDLDGLGSGRAYVFRTQPYQQRLYSEEITQAGNYVIRAGRLQVQLLDGRNGSAYAGRDVYLLEKQVTGSLTGVGTYRTDAEGKLRLDPSGLGTKGYALRALSLADGSQKDSALYSQAGSYVFQVGNAALTVKVTDDISRAALSGLEVHAYEKLSDGTRVWRAKRTTDAQGQAVFDLDGLGSGAGYVFAGQPFAQWLDFGEVSQTGWKEFRVGKLQVQVIDGQTGQPRAAQVVSLKRWQADGNHAAVMSAMTDAQGWLKLDPPAVGVDPYVVQAMSPSDGQIKTSERYWNHGPHRFVLGNPAISIRVQDGISAAGLSGKEVQALERQADGSLIAVAVRTTDTQGAARFDLDGLGSGRAYVFRTQPYQQRLDSEEITQAGDYVIRAGRLQVQLLDGRNGSAYAGRDVYLLEKQVTGSLTGVGTYRTDAEGKLRLDPSGLGTKGYVLRAASLADGMPKDSAAYEAPGSYVFHVGNAPLTVRLIDDVSSMLLAGLEVHAYEKLTDGTKVWRAKQMTNAQGLVVFDLDALGSGKTYVLQGQFYEFWESSADITQPGSFEFRVGRSHDRVPPSVSILAPLSTAKLSAAGVRLNGVADDDMGVREVRVIMTLPSGRRVDQAATYRVSNKTWFFSTGSLADEPVGIIRFVVRALDAGANATETRLDLELIKDDIVPLLSITSHSDGASVPTGGFLISGTVTDNTLSTSLIAALSGGGMAATEVQDVEVATGSGCWSMMISPDLAFTSTPLFLTLTATDGAGNQTVRRLQLNPSDVFQQSWHVAQRTSLGVKTEAYEDALQIGVPGFIQQQLFPDALVDAGFEQRALTWPNDGTQIATRFLRHATYTRRQLQEVLTWFWDNHFNTNYYTHSNSDFEKSETEAFRLNALGNFRALLGVSAHSPAMLYTLDGRFNVKGHPNENYAREVMELHSLGVNGGYTQRDVEEVARAFTGWTVQSGTYYFNAASHDTGAKVVLGRTIPAGGGQSDGETVLDLVASHPATARFICGKLVTLFVSDKPVDGLITRCAATFVAQQSAADQIRQVVSTILNSSEFLGSTYRGAKLKTPIEFVVGAVRQFGGEQAGDDLGLEIQRQGMALYMNPSPTGYPETGDRWLSTSMLLTRSRFADRLLSYSPGSAQTQVNLADAMTNQGFVTGEGVAGRMLEWMLGPTFVRRHRQLALDVLTENGTYPYFATAPDAEIRLRRLGKALMMLPEYQYQ